MSGWNRRQALASAAVAVTVAAVVMVDAAPAGAMFGDTLWTVGSSGFSGPSGEYDAPATDFVLAGDGHAIHVEAVQPGLSLDLTAPEGQQLVSGQIYPPVPDPEHRRAPAAVDLQVGQPSCLAASTFVHVYELATDPQTGEVIRFWADVLQTCDDPAWVTSNTIKVAASYPYSAGTTMTALAFPAHPRPFSTVQIKPKVDEEPWATGTLTSVPIDTVHVTRSSASGTTSFDFSFDYDHPAFPDNVGADPVLYTFRRDATAEHTAGYVQLLVTPQRVTSTLTAQVVGVRLHGVLRDPEGPIAGARIRVDARSTRGVWRTRQVVTNVHGGYTLPALPGTWPWTSPWRCTVTFAGDVQHLPARAVTVTIRPDLSPFPRG